MTAELRWQVETLYTEASVALDEGNFEHWLSFFDDECSYFVTTRENADRGWPLSLVACKTRGMMVDRIAAIRKSAFIVPRTQRRMLSSIRVVETVADTLHCRASFAVFETFVGEPPAVYATGQYQDVVSRQKDVLKLRSRTALLDSSIVPNSVPFPL